MTPALALAIETVEARLDAHDERLDALEIALDALEQRFAASTRPPDTFTHGDHGAASSGRFARGDS